jgi:hypothetical protein
LVSARPASSYVNEVTVPGLFSFLRNRKAEN